MKQIKKGLLILLGLVLLSSAAYFTLTPNGKTLSLVIYHNVFKSSTEFSVDGDKLYMNGYICSKTPDQLEKIINNNPQIKTIVMLEVTGSLDDESNFPMAKWVREQGLNTHLTKNSDIESGGTDFFLSGVNRTMEQGAKIGIHSWRDAISNSEAKDLPKDSPEHKLNKEYIEKMLGNDSFYWYTIYAAPSDGMYFMSNDEIIEYNIVTKPIITE
jgi:hypothetical protein